ncbi:CBS domain-containing protein [Allosalinactinospora lopnorensis]|uniref:CBS domain-containing protein n=1 Tax=Allosalinactinospora lopnorensis TaxID=1352348 RepID=UPI000623C6BE|nr:CBS domain-containing protein [Allosalinactinospora lopnorensis]
MPSTVGDLMTTHVVAARENAEYKEIAVILRTNGVSALPVVDPHRRVVGVVSAADLLLKVADPDPDEGFFPEAYEARIERKKRGAAVARDLMTAPAVTITADAGPREAAELMHRHRVKRLPVVTGDGRLIGLISRVDLLHVYFVRDEQLQAVLAHDIVQGDFGLNDVEVSVRGGVVTLNGRTPHRSDIPRLVHAIRRVEGVVRVRRNLDYEVDDLLLLSGRH